MTQLPPQADLLFPGIDDFEAWEFTFGPGILPGAGSITVANIPGAPFPRAEGDLVLTFAGEKLTFRNCRLGQGSYSFNESGQTIVYQIMDRRWKWQFGTISGRYNIRKPDGTLDGKLEPWSVKSPRELAKLCLEAMGETGFDVRALPDFPRPAIDWDNANPAQALQSLAESLGCRVILGLDDKVRLATNGVGVTTLPDDYLPGGGDGIDPDERPDVLVYIAGPTRYQGPLELRPVGIEKDGQIKPIDELSYKPAGGWETAYPGDFFEISDTKFKLEDGSETSLRELALQWVYRAWQLVETPNVFGLKDSNGTSMPRRRLVLGSTLVDTWRDGEGVKQEKPAYLTGECWHPRSKEYRNFETSLTKVDRLSFSIDAEKQIVHTGDYVYRFNASQDGIEIPKLFLWTSYYIRDEDTNQPLRHQKEKRLTGSPQSKTKVRRPIFGDPLQGLSKTWKAQFGLLGRYQFTQGKVTTNESDVDKEADFYLNAEAARYDVPQSIDRAYDGLRRFQPDGVLQQVTWSFNFDAGCETRVSLTSEHDRFLPRYRDAVAEFDRLRAIRDGQRAFRQNFSQPGGAPG